MKKVIFALCVLSFAFSSCWKKTIEPTPAPKVYVDENPLQGFLQQSGANQAVTVTIVTNSDYYTDGFSFEPLQKGILKAFVARLPKENANLKVTLWNVATKNAIHSEVVNVSAANIEITKSITPITLSKGTEYMITMETQSDYGHSKTDGSTITYPQNVGSIAITGNYSATNTFKMPDVSSNSSDIICYGDISFVFQQTE
jgi:hypothetical protein